MKKHIAVDIGASSGRLVVGTYENGKILLKEFYRFPNGIEEQNGNYFWNIEKIINEIVNGLKAAKKEGIDECTLGIDTWGVDYALIDVDGNRIQEIYAYRDERTKTAIEKIKKQKSLKDIYKKIGIQFLSFNTLFQLYAHDQEELMKAHKILLVPDYLYYRLSGRLISEKTNASTTQLLNLETKEYDEELLQLIGVKREQFETLTEPGEFLGPVRESIIKEHDIPQCELICVATHDTASAVLGVPGAEKHFAYLCSGTWSLMGVENRYPIANEQSYSMNYTNEWGAYGTYRFLKNIMGLWLIQEVRRQLEKEYSFADLVMEAKKIKPFQFLIDCNDECFLKPENMVLEVQHYCQKSGQSVPQTAGELARCIFDSLALMYRKTLKELALLNEYPIHSLHVVGGGVQNEMLCQLTADVAELPVIAGPIESTALGNIIVQMISCGEIADAAEARKVTRESFPITIYQPAPVHQLERIVKQFIQLTSGGLER
ncbi:L-rhamnulokinase [Pelosinus fermentans]|uniref:Rhamnulokinase n=1 Tax=Pelosinus fermentans B4 TaxID=1149862 RepID=I8RMN5_9FIRM|nr:MULTISPECIES: rhamnulokinase [Pelosinus]EIW20150.1 rhamnulokinase [Pelosinus fermentans B4]OAM93044.1 Rhamnulokinase [Pelosinus fermentans DSM 17108]SDQ65115.1 L-rhamnulokinase [Pelosinus fermentans]